MSTVEAYYRISDYYSDFYTNLPVASISEDGAIDLRYKTLHVEPQPESLFNVSGLHCEAFEGDLKLLI